ncbi:MULTISPECIES: MarR family winged helix-turn-helix transcriptional regulator [Chryseobacterium]|uniref:MarR family winged helix-turn-helix transcriptional regulator n=1 Tax=Chryseobacterium TaxID=59732 RepID=UPI0015561604|nr:MULTISPECIES: MarR family transcriptional regulator [unclassified Chryseobacterium]MDC8103418.1 MarR family transcriptional regulator [Chryseobacterium sp. B21-037]MDQ1802975.1 MarR family transcriptional regulator [Chryseobacterium sp. CKR4-1]WBV56952.1 MarR family transcriptional regulator [Chryseobacterium daecheongense]
MSRNKIEQIGERLKEQSTHAVRRSNLIAAQLKINPTDLEALEVLLRNGKATAGTLSSETGISGGAVTKMIDRLEKADFVKRVLDKSDRRKVIIEPNLNTIQQRVFPLYAPLIAATTELFKTYSDQELDIINGFMEKILQISSDDLNQMTSDL